MKKLAAFALCAALVAMTNIRAEEQETRQVTCASCVNTSCDCTQACNSAACCENKKCDENCTKQACSSAECVSQKCSSCCK